MNLIVSGWPGTGTTTFAILSASLLKFKYLYAGSVMRYLGDKVAGAKGEMDFARFEQQFGPIFDSIWDRDYAPWKLKHTDRLVLDSKIAGFFNEDAHTFEVILIATPETRIARATSDQRQMPAAAISARDRNLQERWNREMGINLYDYEQLRENYDLVMDNTNLSIEAELQMLLQYLEEDSRFPRNDLQGLKEKVNATVAQYWKGGKQQFLYELDQNNLLIKPQDVLEEWKKHFGKQLKDSGLDRWVN